MRYIDFRKLEDKLAKLDGKPPYNDPGNICWNDGYFARSIEDEFCAPIDELRKALADHKRGR